MPRGIYKRKALQATPVETEKPTFVDVFEQHVGLIARVHGQEVANGYRALREQEALLMQAAGVPYPPSEEQMQEFFSERISTE